MGFFENVPKAQWPLSITLDHTQPLGMPTTRYAEWQFDEEGKVKTVEISGFSIFL